jgi:hypothetical protein
VLWRRVIEEVAYSNVTGLGALSGRCVRGQKKGNWRGRLGRSMDLWCRELLLLLQVARGGGWVRL